MRYDKLIFLVKREDEVYNPDTGDYESGTKMYEKYAHISSAGTQTLKNLYGGVKEGAIVIRLKHNTTDFDEIIIGNKTYLPQVVRELRQETTIHAVEKQI